VACDIVSLPVTGARLAGVPLPCCWHCLVAGTDLTLVLRDAYRRTVISSYGISISQYEIY
jgi:hypothetical protein